MKHSVIALVFAFLWVGCMDTNSRRHYATSSGPLGCRQFASCGTCTPILGCGWCTIGSGGMCVDDPNDCAAASSFQWTWEPSGCPAVNDAGPMTDSVIDSVTDSATDSAADSAADAETSVDGGADAAQAVDGDTDAEAPDAADAGIVAD